MQEINTLYINLETYLEALYGKFLWRYEALNTSTEDYRFDFKAYCLLAHSAFEEYFEEITRIVSEYSIKNWLNHRKTCIAILALLGSSKEESRLKHEDEKNKNGSFIPQRVIQDNLDGVLRSIQGQMQEKVIDKHNTIYLSDLRKMLTPVGVDVTNDTVKIASLNELIKARGDFAHKSTLNTVVQNIQPLNMKDHVDTCLEICKEVRNSAITALNNL